MQKDKFIKSWAQIKKHKNFILPTFLFLIFSILIPVVAFTYNTPSSYSGSISTGYLAPAGVISGPMFAPEAAMYSGTAASYYSGTMGFCVKNTSSNNYFVPTRSASELRAFFAGRPSNLYIIGCLGDGICDADEPCDSTDCGGCSYSGGGGGGSDPCGGSMGSGFYASCY